MNLLNEKAKHNKFGVGVIKSNENGTICIHFGDEFGEKSFIFPDAFKNFLKLENDISDKAFRAELAAIQLEKEFLKNESERMKEEAIKAQQDEAKLVLKTAKALAAKKEKKEKAERLQAEKLLAENA